MKFTAAVDPHERYVLLGALAYSERLIVVLEGRDVVGSVPRADIRSIRIELRPSFKHPIVGLILGGLLVAVPIGLTLMGLYYNPLLTLSITLVGFYLMFGAARTRKVPWLIVITNAGERAFMLYAALTPEVEAFAQALNESAGESGPEYPNTRRGFPVIPQTHHLPGQQKITAPPSPSPSPASASSSPPSTPPTSSPSHPDKTY